MDGIKDSVVFSSKVGKSEVKSSFAQKGKGKAGKGLKVKNPNKNKTDPVEVAKNPDKSVKTSSSLDNVLESVARGENSSAPVEPTNVTETLAALNENPPLDTTQKG